jgi:rare lipoprotein A (peptidoglycan hydrolase)
MGSAAPTYYSDGSVWNNDASGWGGSNNNTYAAQYQVQPQRSSRSSRSSRSTAVQPNTYLDGSAQSNWNTGQQASNWASQPNTYTAEGYAPGYNQWDSGYQAKHQTSQKRGLISRMFKRDENPAVQSTSYSSYSPAGLIRGVASWYGSDFHGGKTANGERYDMYSMTAAHRTLPFGTLVKVTNESNGKECVVRINNRGPYLKGRILDLSKAAASQLGFLGRGVTRVRMQVLGQ